MGKIMFAWLGITDRDASKGIAKAGLGPIATALKKMSLRKLVLLNSLEQSEAKNYIAWLQSIVDIKVDLRDRPLENPTDFELIYRSVVAEVELTLKESGPDVDLVYHLSPGTPAMAAVWIIIAKTRYPAEMIQSSQKDGVRTVALPFEISAEFIPDLLRRPDKELERLSMGLPPEAPEFSDIIHRSPEMNRIVARARRVAPRSVPVLILGESGTGKELMAKAVHDASPRRQAELITVNCGAIAKDIIESELFGYEKGAFTGATERRQGYFEAANGGTLFLDEIGELPLKAQVTLLRILQEGEVLRLGARKPIKVNVRVIAATNRDLIREIEEGGFREDLYYRLAVAVLKLPPLRERTGDLGLLIDGLMDQINEESRQEPDYSPKTISPGARNVLLNHSWPGNVRELKNTLLRAAVWTAGETITELDMREALFDNPHPKSDNILDQPFGDGIDLPLILQKVAKHYLERALQQSHGNKTRAATLVGLSSYQTLDNWLKKYGIQYTDQSVCDSKL